MTIPDSSSHDRAATSDRPTDAHTDPHTDASGVAGPARSRRSMFGSPAFIVAAVVLTLAALGLNASVSYLRLSFKKLPVPLRQSLKDIPGDLGPWRQVSRDQPLESDIQQALGTEQYIFRVYVDQRVVGSETIDKLRTVDGQDYAREMARVQSIHPEGVVHLGVTYYTGLVDTVAHIPDRCYVADGYEPRDYQVEHWEIASQPVQVRFINFEDQVGYGKQVRSVAYFFQVNGRYTDDPLAVRIALQNLRERYGYYAKVEVMDLLSDKDRSAQVLTDFLSQAMGSIEHALPHWPPDPPTAKAGANPS
jgi:hypothetical protein